MTDDMRGRPEKDASGAGAGFPATAQLDAEVTGGGTERQGAQGG